MCVRVRVCVHVCLLCEFFVCLPQGYKLHSCNIEPVQPAEQVCYIYKHNEAFYIWAWPL